eukprot:TRINITY_DN4551_c0_g1_i3.p2 TRINITY_DN4551_c0_g1~~TRINITY_DN4551_c0_g1_i3.p2  ORF type:complete len:200 (-),score=64.80 TRINITY_DN4551_c0_g1_i3:31-630(-)
MVSCLYSNISKEILEKQFDTNVYGVVRVDRAALPHLREKKAGRVLYVSSIGGRGYFPFNSVYGCSKFALEGMVTSARYELEAYGIEAYLIEPGAFGTSLGANMSPQFAENSMEVDPINTKRVQNLMAGFAKAGSGGLPDPMDCAKIMFDTCVNGADSFRISAGPGLETMDEMNVLNEKHDSERFERYITWMEPEQEKDE